MKLQIHQGIIGLGKLFYLRFFPAERADDADAGKIFPCGFGYAVQTGLDLFVAGSGPAHNAEDNHRQHWNDDNKNQSHLHVDGKCP